MTAMSRIEELRHEVHVKCQAAKLKNNLHLALL